MTVATVEELLREIVGCPDMILVVGGEHAVSEGMLEAGAAKWSTGEGWANVEAPGWHIHLHLARVAQVRFVEEPSACLGGRTSYSIRLADARGEALLRIYFNNLYDEAGALRPERRALLDDLQRRFGHLTAGTGSG
ncbi:MAG: hypothetical protein HYV08_07425 [Deltaproteobacteria bacterium]|nr:hypothetical protein [Deltaproteobacteria bacterium]MBI3078236.1 hypothetical protein [Deltaproteobacteria bacterium]